MNREFKITKEERKEHSQYLKEQKKEAKTAERKPKEVVPVRKGVIV